jgi:hypothetical protein
MSKGMRQAGYVARMGEEEYVYMIPGGKTRKKETTSKI